MQCELKKITEWNNLLKTTQELLTKTNLTFDHDKITIRDMDETHTAFIHISISKNLFTNYKIFSTTELGIDVANLYKILKNLKPPTCLKLHYSEDKGDGLSILVYKDDTCKKRNYTLPLFSINSFNTEIKDLPISVSMTMESRKFYDLCTHLLLFDDSCTVHIDILKKQLKFSSYGDIGNVDIEYDEKDKHVELDFIKKDITRFKQSFSLEKWKQFSQAYTLSDTVCLSFSKDSPLLVEYKLNDDLGFCRFYLAPKVDDSDF